jgi:5-formyltetrahydrofolate cyclo-ligase
VVPHSPDLSEAKRIARTAAMARRAGCDPALGSLLAQNVLHACPPPAGAVVSGFWSIGDEIDIRPLLIRLHRRGHDIALPVTPSRGNPLTFRLWRPGDKLVRERFGTMRAVGPAAIPDFLLVPLLAFDPRGHRLGYGAGYYDRTIDALPDAFTLGCAYAIQEVPEVPAGPHDKPLDAIATEQGVVFVGKDP